MTQAELAEAVGVERESITKYESGQYQPKLAAIVRMVDTLDTSLDYLLGRTDNPGPEWLESTVRVVRPASPYR